MADDTKKSLLARLADDIGERLSNPVRVLAFALATFVMLSAGYAAYKLFCGQWSVLDQLCDPDYARGLITLAISFVTLTLATVLVIAPFASSSDEQRYRRAQEVFGVLAGILGTIVGSYFGSAVRQRDRLRIVGVRPRPGQVKATIVGGRPPYRYTLSVGDKAHVESRQSETA